MMALPGRYENVSLWDISAAYPYTMKNMEFPRRFVHYRRKMSIPRGVQGFARAEVTGGTPDQYGPLPVRVGEQISYPSVLDAEVGIWSLTELQAAEDSGEYAVKIKEAWIGEGNAVLFNQTWYDHILEGRALPGIAGKLAKLTSVATWGGFMIQGGGEWIEFGEQGEIERVADGKKLRPLCWPIAALVTGAVRSRLYSEGLTQDFCFAAHTDGGIYSSSHAPSPLSSGTIDSRAGQWRLKARASAIDLLSPQVYRYWESETGQVRHVVSGAPERIATQIFALRMRQAIREGRYHNAAA